MPFLIPKKSTSQRIEFKDYTVLGSGACERQAKIEQQNKSFVLKDLRSEKGAYLNGQRIYEAPLKHGDWVQVGDEEMLFLLSLETEKKDFCLTSKNPQWNEKLRQLSEAAQSHFPVLALGPSGAGKEIIAQSVHQGSPRRKGNFVSVNCSALSENLIESELFGHIKGSFTGAIQDRKGAFESARGGTLFLDEIGDLPISLQAKLLRALENNEIRPVGSDINIKTDVRIIAATHQNLIEKIKNGEFRADLYYRLNVIKIEVPSLFERLDDFEDILYQFSKTWKVRFSHDAIQRLKKHNWPGNIRELKNTVARASAVFSKQLIEEKDVESILDQLGDHNCLSPSVPLMPLPVIKEMEKQLIIRKLIANKGNQKRTAHELGLPKSTLHDRLKTYQINPKSFAVSEL